MDSSSRRLPFCLSSSRSSYTSSPSVSSSSLGSSRLSSRETTFSNDRFQWAPSSYKTDLDQQNSRYLSSSRDYGSSDNRSTSWRLPTSLTTSSRSYDYSRNDSSLSSRSKLSDSDGRLGMRSGLLNSSDDGDSKRAKLSYSNRGLYSRPSNTSLTGSVYSTTGLSSGRGVAENPKDVFDSSRSTGHSRSSSSTSKPFSSWREQETKYEPRLLGLGERRTPGVASSLYQTDRVTSTYAQGARPKETSYTSSSSSTARERSFNHQFSSSSSSSSSASSSVSHFSPLVQEPSSRASARLFNSSNLRSSQNQTAIPESSSHVPSSYSRRSSWYTRPESTLPPRPACESEESQGRSSTRRLLSRLFSRRSSQDSSSGSSSVRSLDDDSPSTGGESVDGDEGTRNTSVDLDHAGLEATLSGLRNGRADLTPIQENRGGVNPDASRMSSWREPGVGSSNGSRGGAGGNSSWISSSLRGRCPPLLSRLRRHTRHENVQSPAGSEEEEGGAGRPQRLLRRWEDAEQKTSEDEDGDEEEGAVGLEAFGAAHPWEMEDESLPELEEGTLSSSRRRRAPYQNPFFGPLRSAEISLDSQKEKPDSIRDQEKLRKIKESLLLEESDEDEGDLCRICQMGEDAGSNPLIQPCRCTGSLQYVHQECIKRWLCSKIGSGTNLEAITTCELCKAKLRLNIDDFDIQELYRTHAQSEYDEFISSGLYLVVLLHFCEQRFSDVLGAVDAAGLFNLVRLLHEHMDSLRNSNEDSDGEVPDGRPSIDFSDLDEDLEDVFEERERGE